METIFSTTTEQITTSTPGLINNITINPQEIILTQPVESFFDKQWVIALIGAIAGIALSELFSWLRDIRRSHTKRKAIAREFYIDIITNRSTNNRDIPSVENFFVQFQQMAAANNFTSQPTIQYTGRDLLKYYNSRLLELGLFDRSVGLALYAFYGYVDSVIATTKLLDDKLKRFYRDDPTVGAQDVIDSTEKKIQQMKLADITGVIALALLINKYKIDSVKKTKEIIKAEKRINDALSQVRDEHTIEIKQISHQCSADMLLAATILLKRKDFKDVGLGKYKKI